VTTIERFAFLITILSAETPYVEKSALGALSSTIIFSISGAACGATAISCAPLPIDRLELAGDNAAQDASMGTMMATANKDFLIFIKISFL